jgi:hypothetical protein
MWCLSTPDFEAICAEYMENKDIGSLLGLTIGGQRDSYDWHGMVYDFDYVDKSLRSIGLTNIKRYDWRKTEMLHIDDYSQSYLPHMDKENGRLMSLNIEATKK